MDAFFSHITALEILRRWDSGRLLRAATFVPDELIPKRMPSIAELERITSNVRQLAGATLPLHVIVSSDAGRHKSKLAVAHIALKRYPKNSHVHLAPNVACASPELVALQMTEYATETELLLLVDELCGYYGIQPNAKSGLVKREEPLTSVSRISSFLDELGPVRGTRKLRRALEHARDRSGSPQESRTCHRFELDMRHGGYDIKVAGLNDPIAVERAGAILGEAAKRIRKPDIILLAPDHAGDAPTPFKAVAVDYQGAYHRDDQQESKDINRRNELLARDIKDYEIAKEHYDDIAYLDWLARCIRHDLGLPEPKLTERESKLWAARKADLNARLARADGLHWTNRDQPLVMSGARDFDGETVGAGALSPAVAQ